jgi:hypothetical protein
VIPTVNSYVTDEDAHKSMITTKINSVSPSSQDLRFHNVNHNEQGCRTFSKN